MSAAVAVTLRPYCAADEDAAIALWLRSWQAAYPGIDFAARLNWWRARWRDALVGHAEIVLAETDGVLAGFITVDVATGELDQLAVAPEQWGAGVAGALIAEAKRLSPGGLQLHVNQDNSRAIGFYRREGFSITGEAMNPTSGLPIYAMRWSLPLWPGWSAA